MPIMSIREVSFILLFLFCFEASADLSKSPSPFIYAKDKKAVWVDFHKAHYEIVFDIKKKEAHTVSQISFSIKEEGFPIFDSVAEPELLSMNNEVISQKLISTPGKETKIRVINKKLQPGKHTLKIKTPISSGVSFDQNSVSAGFFMRDMRDREFLEKYLPSNLEFDQYKITINAKVVGTNQRHELFSNGRILNTENNVFKIDYPDHYNSSSLFFHLVPKKKFKTRKSQFKSIDGRSVPVIVYSKNRMLNSLATRKVFKVMRELEKDYGPWPHPQFILYANGKIRGGMEYAGAAVSGWFAIGHEIQHSYFARGVMPKDGNAGWLDEGIASWRDYYHRSKKKVGFSTSNLAGGSEYTRKTSLGSYKKGRAFIGHLDYLLKRNSNLCLKDFLNSYFQKRKFTTVSTDDFIKDLEEYSGQSFQSKFDEYIFGRGQSDKSSEQNNPYHLQLTEKELLELI